MFRSLFRSISRGRRKQHAHDDHHGDHDADYSRGLTTWSRFTESPEAAAFGHSRRQQQQAYHDDPDYEDDEAEHNDLGHHGDDEDDDDEQQAGGYFSLRPRRDRFDGPSYFDRDPGVQRRYRRGEEHGDDEDYDPDDNEDGDPHNDDDEDAGSAAPLLPIFSSAHLDGLPLYNITHAIRLLIVQRCETTLSWDQLRSPQISQFLVKPIQREIREGGDAGGEELFNRATLCALVANCLQFHKEAQMNPANVGVLRTRALISELLAMRLLRDFSPWELIDALSYDFNPLQGVVVPTTTAVPSPQVGQQPSSDGVLARKPNPSTRVARISTIEVAIRAEAKRFLAHPVVVQHLEAIWAGNIVFHSEQDNLHRRQQQQRSRRFRMVDYGTTGGKRPAPEQLAVADSVPARRSVTLYDPRDASLFKLSRLRVPRYRQVFSTLSFATMLALFVAVLVDRSLDITPLEVLFWLWSAGYMLDEVVGFTEQGFGLYILSFWNAFDLGILLLFAIYYCLRLYGVVVADTGKHRIASIAYDVLASTAILLFPRLFGVLDHYRYFSQLLIAFRLMAQDLMAILVLIVIFCSGFFVAFTLSFSDDNIDANGVAYILFQIVMGFTPAAWDHWASYNILGQALMALFLIICHFLIVTILITVLTNSFMAIVKNAEAEHQFLFAINTISMVKSDALFSYIAPTNLLGWLLSPLRYLVPLRQYVKFNRTIIKVTHSPILFVIFAYERLIMARSSFGRTPDLLTQHHPPATMTKAPTGPVAFSLAKAAELFSPGGGGHHHRMREASVISVRKDAALEEVFRRPFRGGGGDTLRTTATTAAAMSPQARGPGSSSPHHHHHLHRSQTAVDKWMQIAENAGGPSPPLEQPRSVVDRLEGRRPPTMARGGLGAGRRMTTADRLRRDLQRSREFSTGTRSVDGQSMRSVSGFLQPPQPHPSRRIGVAQPALQGRRLQQQQQQRDAGSTGTRPQETDADADVDETGHDETNNEADDDEDDSDNPSATPLAVRLGESAISVHQHTQTEEEGGEDDDSESEFFQTPMMGRGTPSPFLPSRLSHAAEARLRDSPEPSIAVPNTPSPLGSQAQQGASGRATRRPHQRLASSGTILFAPTTTTVTSQPRPVASGAGDDSTSSSHPRPVRPISRKHASPPTKAHSPPLASGAATPSRTNPTTMSNKPSRPTPTPRASRPTAPQRQKTAPLMHVGGLTFIAPQQHSHFPSSSASRPRRIAGPRREPSFNARALDLASEIGDNAFTGPLLLDGGLGGAGAGSLPNSLSEQLVREQRVRQRQQQRRVLDDEDDSAARNPRKTRQQLQAKKADEDAEHGVVSRIMLARMHTLEEGFREVLREIKELSNSQYPGSSRRDSEIEGPSGPASLTQPVNVGRGGRPTLATAAPGLGSSSSAPKTPGLGRVLATAAVGAPAGTGKVGVLSSSPRKLAAGAARKERAAKRASKGSTEGGESAGSSTAATAAATGGAGPAATTAADAPESSPGKTRGNIAAGEGEPAQQSGEGSERRPVTAVRKEEEGWSGREEEDEEEVAQQAKE